MNHILNNTLKIFALFSLYFSTLTLQAMKPITIVINNYINNRNSSVQVCFSHLQEGVNIILSKPVTLQCYTYKKEFILTEKDELIKKAKRFALLRLSDPTSKEKHIELKITNNKIPIIVHDFDEQTRKIRITKGKKEIGFFTYPPAHNKHL